MSCYHTSRSLVLGLLLCVTVQSAVAQTRAARPERGVRLVKDEAARRVDVFIEGQPFTSYIWPETIMKPVLYPLRTAAGTVLTRGFPLAPQPFERADHPHQVGLWFNYGDVNGVDFWNNSTARTPEEKTRMGTILHRRITALKGGRTQGELSVECDWMMPDGQTILREYTRFIFYAGNGHLRMLDRQTTLTALDREVLFRDNKEGLMALRVARSLEQPTTTRDIFLDANGQAGTVPIENNEGATGRYVSSEGKTGDDVFGTRGRWAMLSGKVGDESVTLAILDHPQNIGYPAYWFARGYGLFAANSLGQKAFSTERKETPIRELNFKLAPRQAVTFRFRVLIKSGATPTPAEVEAEQRRFAARGK